MEEYNQNTERLRSEYSQRFENLDHRVQEIIKSASLLGLLGQILGEIKELQRVLGQAEVSLGLDKDLFQESTFEKVLTDCENKVIIFETAIEKNIIRSEIDEDINRIIQSWRTAEVKDKTENMKLYEDLNSIKQNILASLESASDLKDIKNVRILIADFKSKIKDFNLLLMPAARPDNNPQGKPTIQ